MINVKNNSMVENITFSHKILLACAMICSFYNTMITGKEECITEAQCHEIVQDGLLYVYIDHYARLDDETFLATSKREHSYQVAMPLSFTKEKAKSVLACEVSEKIIEQLRNPATRLDAPIKEALVRGRGPFSQKDLLGDKIDIEVDHARKSIKVIVERDPAFYIPAKKAHDERMANRERKSSAEYIFEWYQLDHQA